MSSELLKKELEDMQSQPNVSTGCTVGLFNKNNIYNWKVSLLGAKDTPYAGGIFFIKISFPKDFPKNPPQINFITPIYHLNVCPFKNKINHIEISHIETLGYLRENFNGKWNDKITVREMLTKLYSIFYLQYINVAYDTQRAKEYLENRALFDTKAKFYTNKYANFSKEMIIFDKDWDFSDNKYKMKIYNYFSWSYKDNLKDYENTEIDLLFKLNGIQEVKLKFELKDLTKDVIKEIYEKFKITDKDALYIFDLKKLNLEIPIGANGLKNEFTIIIISDYINKEYKEEKNEVY